MNRDLRNLYEALASGDRPEQWFVGGEERAVEYHYDDDAQLKYALVRITVDFNVEIDDDTFGEMSGIRIYF